MAWRDNLHSRLVAWMKIALPLAALGMLSTLFLISDTYDPSEPLPVAGIDLQQRAHDQGATNATFAGVTRQGHEVVVRTAKSRPSEQDSRQFIAENVAARFALASGTRVDIAARRGEMNQARASAALSGGVTVATTTGYTVRTERLDADFDRLHAESAGPIEGTAPAGELTAGRMVLQADADTDAVHLLFTDGVKLIYHPRTSEE